MNIVLAIEAWTELLYLDLIGWRRFDGVHRLISRTPIKRSENKTIPVSAIVQAMRTACAFYFKSAHCLQRSAVVTRLLRRRGIPADLVIGCQLAPMKAHAWVEVAGDIVSDDDGDIEYYCVLDRW